MTIYFIDKKPDGTTSLFSGEMKDRAKFWVEHPNAKEISKKEYNQWVDYLNSDLHKKTLLKTNR
jgi:hypothetical protein